VFLIPTWSLFHSRHWKMQIPYLARHFRVLTMDGLGNGGSDRCRDPRRYGPAEFARDCLAAMDATGTDRAVMVSLSRGAQYLLELPRLAPRASGRRRLPRPDVPVHPIALVAAAAPAAGLPLSAAIARQPLVGAHECGPLAGRLRGVRRVVRLAGLCGAALDQGHRGRGGMGARHRPRDADRHRGVPSTETGVPCARWRGTWTARCW
jgi:pimeloyl-ACP methyl ester carboxylesterase